ncbi:MAG TPA: phasin family protein [Casimicrobiaceae bacterium]
MADHIDFYSPLRLNLPAFWDVNAKPVDYAEKVFKVWFDATGEMQSQALEFLNERLATDSVAIAKLFQCRLPHEVFGVQAEYARRAFRDFVAGGQAMVAWFDAAQERVLAATADKPGLKGQRARAHKHSAHRAASH